MKKLVNRMREIRAELEDLRKFLWEDDDWAMDRFDILTQELKYLQFLVDNGLAPFENWDDEAPWYVNEYIDWADSH